MHSIVKCSSVSEQMQPSIYVYVKPGFPSDAPNLSQIGQAVLMHARALCRTCSWAWTGCHLCNGIPTALWAGMESTPWLHTSRPMASGYLSMHSVCIVQEHPAMTLHLPYLCKALEGSSPGSEIRRGIEQVMDGLEALRAPS